MNGGGLEGKVREDMTKSRLVSLGREAKRRRETIQTVIVLALLAGTFVYSLVILILHHP